MAATCLRENRSDVSALTVGTAGNEGILARPPAQFPLAKFCAFILFSGFSLVFCPSFPFQVSVLGVVQLLQFRNACV